MRFVLLLILLTACQKQSLEFCGVAPVAIQLAGDKILVYQSGNRAQAVRTNARSKAQRKGAVERLIAAIEITTRCTVRQRGLKGDEVLITASLACPKSDS